MLLTFAQTLKRNIRACQKTDDEKLLATNRKGKNVEEKHGTYWFETYSNNPRKAPLDLSACPDLTIGDVYYHRSYQGIQLWLWAEGPDGSPSWTPAVLGQQRDEDGRYLALTPSDKPTWNGLSWYRKKTPQSKLCNVRCLSFTYLHLAARVFVHLE